MVGSLSPTYTENALFSRDDRRRDFFYEPDVSLRLDGSLSPDLSYRIFARTQYESFATEHLGNAAIARLGARLTQNLYGWRITGQYENRYDFDGVYRDLAFTSNDVMRFGRPRLPVRQRHTFAARAAHLPVFRPCRSSPLAFRCDTRDRSQARSEMVDRQHAIHRGILVHRRPQRRPARSDLLGVARIEVQYGQQCIAHHQRHLRSANLERSLASLHGCADRSETRLRLLNDGSNGNDHETVLCGGGCGNGILVRGVRRRRRSAIPSSAARGWTPMRFGTMSAPNRLQIPVAPPQLQNSLRNPPPDQERKTKSKKSGGSSQ